jgi:hypothetical protein
VQRRIFGPKGKVITMEWRKTHNEQPHNLCSSPNIVRMTKSRRMGWAGHVERMWTMRNTKFWSENLKGGHLLENLSVHRKILLN